jgi:CRISPR/Cas system CSM-associated protein Csm2 small subunit
MTDLLTYRILLVEEIVRKAIPKIKPGLLKYLHIRSRINKVDVSNDEDFQRAYNGFYRMRQRPPIYYEKYYSYMEENKSSGITFEKTLNYLFEELGRVEPSFSSKLVATIDPSLPIWDSVVLNNFKLKPPAYYRKNRVSECINLYNVLVKEYKELMETEEANSTIKIFDNVYPNTGLTDLKKVDFVLWQVRD